MRKTSACCCNPANNSNGSMIMQTNSGISFKALLILALLVLLSPLLLTGCASNEPQVVKTKIIRESVPATLLAPVSYPPLDGSYGDYMAACEASIRQCNTDKTNIGLWPDDQEKQRD